MNEYILKTINLTKKFKNHCAVNNVSLNIKENTVYGILYQGHGLQDFLRRLFWEVSWLEKIFL